AANPQPEAVLMIEPPPDFAIIGIACFDIRKIDLTLTAITLSQSASLRSTITTVAPSRPNNSAVARPMPEAPPVISAILPANTPCSLGRGFALCCFGMNRSSIGLRGYPPFRRHQSHRRAP